MLDPQPGDDPDAAYQRMGKNRRERFEALLEDLEAIAPAIFINQVSSRQCCDVMKFILGMDIEDPSLRAQAIIARAYWRADEYTHTKAEVIAKAEECSDIVSRFDRFNIDSRAEDAIEVFAQLQIDNLAERRGREEEIRRGLDKLDNIVDALRVFAAENRPSGRPSDEGRLFFVLRLAEAFTIWTGRPPDFDTGERRGAPEWLNFIEVALELGGLGNPDKLSRRLCDLAPVEGAFPGLKRLKTADGELEWFRPRTPIIHREGELKLAIKELIYQFYDTDLGFSKDKLPSSDFLKEVWRGGYSREQPFEPAAYEWFLPPYPYRRWRS